MSVKQESLNARGKADKTKDAPELEYSLVRSESVAMFGAAIGGAVLGMLLTLLVLAIVNGGTLRFSGGERLTSLEANVARINDNVGAVSFNVDTVAEQLGTVASSLEGLRNDVDSSGTEIDQLNSAIATLDVTRQQFDTFVSALSEAMTAMQELGGETIVEEVAPAAEAAPAPQSAPAEPSAPVAPLVELSADVPTGGIAVLLFADANNNGLLEEGEAIETGMMATLFTAAGEEVNTAETTDAGILFEGLEAGDYQVSVEGIADVTVTVAEGAEEGQVVYIPVAAGE